MGVYGKLSDTSLEVHRKGVQDALADIEKEIDERNTNRAPKPAADCPWPQLAVITNDLSFLSDATLQSLVTAWSTHGGLIEAELQRRADAHREKYAIDPSTLREMPEPSARFVRNTFADMLKEQNGAGNVAAVDYAITCQPFDYSPFSDLELVNAWQGLEKRRNEAILCGDLWEANHVRDQQADIVNEQTRRRRTNAHVEGDD